MDITTLRQHWKLSSKIRLEAFRNEKDKLFSRLYPALKRPDAFSLIFIDFESLYPNANKFKTEWDKNENKFSKIK
ncbi:hypothetical protein PVAND_017746 [Polypedilum vanderplanki]|uniref:Uncharacterized protein n=1 Tax=Polypedilum vanderplanki TaxID=319348 RepID=A0A9J6B977_POLVA|nr:hypothetical protein PVAND_017746 [Polypedilum vanderplanki]